ncbi:MAG: hypothetical protein IKQ06_01405 [Bacilli bacterium]|nr:hypothetical protein [Bacilli bacterium]
MDIQNLKEKYNNSLCIRDTLPAVKKEVEELEENPLVKRYLELSLFCKQNRDFDGKSDDQVLEFLLRTVSSDEKEYFCLGKNYWGYLQKMGSYYLVQGDHKLYSSPTMVGWYRNLYNPNDQVIIPVEETQAFEELYPVVHATSVNPEIEYFRVRNEKYMKLMGEEPQKLEKK